jgi:hypothetical protein
VKRVEANHEHAIGPAPAPAEPIAQPVPQRTRGHRISDGALMALLVAVQIAWLALLVYVLFWAL